MTIGTQAIWLDLTRIVSRTGRGPFTGIDRVELAYLEHLLDMGVDLMGFVRTATGFVVLNAEGSGALLARVTNREPWGRPDLQGRLSRRLSPARRAAEADLRRLAVASSTRAGLGGLLRKAFAPGTAYLNVGHSNLDPKVLGGFSRAGGVVAVMLHDAIPLELPEDHETRTVARFEERLEAVKSHANMILTPSWASAKAIRSHMKGGPNPIPVPLGVTLATPEALPRDLVLTRPYFVSIGTIDGRKNQEFLVDLWGRMGAHPPLLCLAGARGVCAASFTAKLDDLPSGVVELNGLSDGAIARLVEQSAGLLHPSKAEGFGFPLLEALLRDVPVIANDLPVYRETVGDNPVYLPPNDQYQWKKAIEALVKNDRQGKQKLTERLDQPTWTTHLNLVLTQLREAGAG